MTVNPVKMQHLVHVHKHALLPYDTPITPHHPWCSQCSPMANKHCRCVAIRVSGMNNSLSLVSEPRHQEMFLSYRGGSHSGAPGCWATAVHERRSLCLLPESYSPWFSSSLCCWLLLIHCLPWGSRVNTLGLLIREKRALVVIIFLLPRDIVFTQVDHYIVKLWGLWLASRT